MSAVVVVVFFTNTIQKISCYSSINASRLEKNIYVFDVGVIGRLITGTRVPENANCFRIQENFISDWNSSNFFNSNAMFLTQNTNFPIFWRKKEVITFAYLITQGVWSNALKNPVRARNSTLKTERQNEKWNVEKSRKYLGTYSEMILRQTVAIYPRGIE